MDTINVKDAAALFKFIGVTNLKDAKQSITGLRERVKFTETFEQVRGDLEMSGMAHMQVREICAEVGVEAAFVDDAVRAVIERLKSAESASVPLSPALTPDDDVSDRYDLGYQHGWKDGYERRAAVSAGESDGKPPLR
jgi:hypothetical protein